MNPGPLHDLLRDLALRLRDGEPLNLDALGELRAELEERAESLQEGLEADPSPDYLEDLDAGLLHAAEAYAEAARCLELAVTYAARGEADAILARVYEAGDLLRAVRQIAGQQRSDLDDYGWEG